ncbi:FCD domain-containing protein [candidate division KSB3 bacterium]|uniref:FCD domain-containing protein n=1 Tax=candidate division KSB3 bacterium TaxID=2044937 RepID=A0A9D5Q8F9_9BACT|nr:FCD domain-containing protein [candidate division KSB3 bacterium]MBD3327433.1 FCD domain-containing protein [candidate division KSB3 bacterium]
MISMSTNQARQPRRSDRLVASANTQKGQSLKQVAYDQIGQWLLDGIFQPGEALIETELAARLGISRTPVREALQQLAQEGLVEMVPRRGAFVRRVTLQDIEELFVIREAIEGIAARLAATKADADQLQRFAELFEAADREPDETRRQTLYEEAGDDFHAYILESCGNTRIIEIIGTYKVLLQKERQIAANIPGRIDRSSQEHRAILHALQQRDPDLAERAMRQHIVGTLNSMLESYRK